MVKVRDIYNYIDSIAPFETQMDFDNSGLLIGDGETEIDRMLVALDVTPQVVREAVRRKCQLIVTHHPVIFHPLKALDPHDVTGGLVVELVRRNIAVISVHTNLDVAPGGVNDVLLAAVGAEPGGVMERMGERDGVSYGLGRWGELPQILAPKEFARQVKKALNAKGVRVVLGDRPVEKIAVCGGAGGDLISLAAKLNVDAYVTGDVRYHEFLEAHQRGITLIDGGHFATENPVVPVLADGLTACFAAKGVEVFVSASHKEVCAGL